jgi:hypothetical protein
MRGGPADSWRAIESQINNGARPELTPDAQAIVRQKAAMIESWAKDQKLDYSNEESAAKAQKDLLDRIWRWLLGELSLTDDGTGYTR